jgi:two-component system chemotaxis response regulator CheY
MRTVLTVDDSSTMRQIVSFCLKGAGYAVLEAADASDALATMRAQRVDLVISDLNMGKVDGITLVKLIRAQPAHRYTPILLLTTESSDKRKAEGQAAGATGWLVKPFEPAQLLKVVKRVLPG